MNCIEKVWNFAIRDTDISEELISLKAIAKKLDVQLNEVIQTRTALEIKQLREALLTMWGFRDGDCYPFATEKLLECLVKNKRDKP